MSDTFGGSSSPLLDVNLQQPLAANIFLASPGGAADPPTLRSLNFP
jgi:hypothetical protein